MPAYFTTNLLAGFKAFDDAATTFEALGGIADGLRRGREECWAEGTDGKKYLWNPSYSLLQKATEEANRLTYLVSMLDGVAREGLASADYQDFPTMYRFNKRTFHLASKASYFSRVIGIAEQELRAIASSNYSTAVSAVVGMVTRIAEAYKELKGLLASVESKANLALKKVARDTGTRV